MFDKDRKFKYLFILNRLGECTFNKDNEDNMKYITVYLVQAQCMHDITTLQLQFGSDWCGEGVQEYIVGYDHAQAKGGILL